VCTGRYLSTEFFFNCLVSSGVPPRRIGDLHSLSNLINAVVKFFLYYSYILIIIIRYDYLRSLPRSINNVGSIFLMIIAVIILYSAQ